MTGALTGLPKAEPAAPRRSQILLNLTQTLAGRRRDSLWLLTRTSQPVSPFRVGAVVEVLPAGSCRPIRYSIASAPGAQRL